MQKRLNILFSLTLLTIFLSACSKDAVEYNKPAIYWYGKIVASISNGNVDKADDYYSSLQGEHIGSPLLPEATMILAIAHMHVEEYLLTEHFLNEYIKRYANENEIEFAEYLKVKSKYMALPNPRRDQVLISEAIKDAKAFKQNYPHSMYYSLVDSMLTNLYLSNAVLNETIASLYTRIDKPRAAAYYRAIMPEKWINWKDVEKATTPWYKEIFEGDGTSSWYAFLIPDTRSVVSRNTVQYDANETNETK
jgi:outer membrane protein assembly factor BamD